MLAVCVTALLCWLAMSRSAALSCEDLLQPLDRVDFQHLEGRWAMLAGGLSDMAHVDGLKSRDSTAIVFANSSDSSDVTFTRIFNVNDSCQYSHTAVALEGGGFTLSQFNVTATFHQTSCRDCIVMKFDNKAKNRRRLYLFSRKREVEQQEVEEFTAQAACLNMTSPIWTDATKTLCPEQTALDPTAQPEEQADGPQA